MHSFIESFMEQLSLSSNVCSYCYCIFWWKTDCISVRIISANSNNGDPECNLHFSIVTKHHSGCCTIKNENQLILQFWVTFDKLVSTHQENDQLEVESTCMQLGEEEHRRTPEFWQFSVRCRAVPVFLRIVTAGFVKLLELTYKGLLQVTFTLFRI